MDFLDLSYLYTKVNLLFVNNFWEQGSSNASEERLASACAEPIVPVWPALSCAVGGAALCDHHP